MELSNSQGKKQQGKWNKRSTEFLNMTMGGSGITYSLWPSKNSCRKITLYQRKCGEKRNSDAEYDKKLVYV